jgi:protein gp37
MNKTKIPWADYSWNPIVGCSPVSEGCENCYAAAISRRFGLPWGSAHFMPDRLEQPESVRKPGRVFVCSMADLGHETVKTEWRELVHAAMRQAPWHQYIVLTKRPGPWLRELPPVCWVLVSIESQQHMIRWTRLLAWAWPGAPVKGVSVEPMMGPVTFLWQQTKPDWTVAGPETGTKARGCASAWIDALAAESPCFFDKRRRWTRREFPN